MPNARKRKGCDEEEELLNLRKPRSSAKKPAMDASNATDELGRPGKRAKALLDIMLNMEEVERLRALLEEKDKSLGARRTTFCKNFAKTLTSPQARQDHCDGQIGVWKSWIKSKLWWSTNGILNSLNDLPRNVLEEILFHAGAITQSQLRFVCKLWNKLIMSPALRRNLCVTLKDLPFNKKTDYSSEYYEYGDDFFDWTPLGDILRPLITKATEVVTFCNADRPDAHCGKVRGGYKKYCTGKRDMEGPFTMDHVFLYDEVTLLDKIKADFGRRSAVVREVVLADFAVTSSDLANLREKWGQSALAQFSVVRGEFSHSITHNLPTYHRVMGSVKKDFVLRGANEKELHLEFLSHLLKPSVPPSDLGALRSFFMLGGSDERKILAVESLKAWEDKHQTITNEGLKNVDWTDLKEVTIKDLRGRMHMLTAKSAPQKKKK